MGGEEMGQEGGIGEDGEWEGRGNGRGREGIGGETGQRGDRSGGGWI